MRPDENKKRHIVVCGKGGGGSENVDWDDIQNKPNFATVASTGDYDDLENKPTIPAAPVQSDWNEADSGSLAYIANKPNLATVATSGNYSDLNGTPTIPAAQVNADWNSASGVSQILNKPSMTTETLTFTLQGGSTVTLTVYTQPSI